VEWLRERKKVEGLENLLLLPFQDFREMPDVLASSDVLIAVLEPEAGVFSVPSKVLSYHCAGRPILGAIPKENLAAQIICQNGSGICVSPISVVEFLEAATQYRSNSNMASTVGVAARRYAEKTFNIKDIARRFELFLSRVVIS